MQEVLFGIIGIGIQGSKYLNYFVNHELKNGKLVAVCDRIQRFFLKSKGSMVIFSVITPTATAY